MNPTNCRHCGRVSPGHYCRTVAPGESKPCIAIAKARNVRASNLRLREQGATLNGGESLGKHNKDLAARLAPLVLRSHGEVAAMMGLSAAGVRVIEMRALAKIRAALLPFKNATSGEHKVRITTKPI